MKGRKNRYKLRGGDQVRFTCFDFLTAPQPPKLLLKYATPSTPSIVDPPPSPTHAFCRSKGCSDLVPSPPCRVRRWTMSPLGQRTHSPPPDPARGRRDPVATGEEQDGHTYTYRSDNQLPFRLNFSSYSATPLQTISGWWV